MYITSIGGINYTVCNVGSCYNNSGNQSVGTMPGEGGFKMHNANGGYYTALPCFANNHNQLYPSLDSNGAALSIFSIDGTFRQYYPAISTYGIK